MDRIVYIALAIGLVLALLAIFFISYLLNKKTPVPKGCENLLINDENCSACNNTECNLKQKVDFDKISEEIKEDK